MLWKSPTFWLFPVWCSKMPCGSGSFWWFPVTESHSGNSYLPLPVKLMKILPEESLQHWTCTNLFSIMYNKVLIYFFLLCPAWTIKPLSHFAFISNQFQSLVHWLAQSFITLRYQKGKMPLKPLKMLKFICLNLQCFRGCPLIWWIPWVLCMCVFFFLLMFLAAMGYINSGSPLENRDVQSSRSSWTTWTALNLGQQTSPGWDVMAEMFVGKELPTFSTEGLPKAGETYISFTPTERREN